MKLSKPALLLAPLLFVTLSVPRAWAADQLEDDYQGKVLTLRHFYVGKRLVFQPDGSLAGSAEVGPWTVDGEIFIQTIKVQGSLAAHPRAARLSDLRYQEGTASRCSGLAEGVQGGRSRQTGGAFRARNVDIDIDLDAENPDEEGVKAAMNKVFLASGESMRDIVPDFWRDYFGQVEGLPARVADSAPLYSVKRGDMSVPRGTYMPNPAFSEEARVAKYQGTMTLSVVVEPSGTAGDVAIVTPLGLGLDEKAVEQVRLWKFKPAAKDGEPVAVKIMVEVDFHLY